MLGGRHFDVMIMEDVPSTFAATMNGYTAGATVEMLGAGALWLSVVGDDNTRV